MISYTRCFRTGKRRYATYSDCVQSMLDNPHQRADVAYRCRYCGGWHRSKAHNVTKPRGRR